MAQTGYTAIQLYHSSTPGQQPLAANLADGELAVNTTDEKLYLKNTGGVVKQLGGANVGANSDITSLSGLTGGISGPTSLTGASSGMSIANALSINGGQLAGMRNRIINGGFAVNQRVYVSGAAVGTGLYGHDRWKMAASGDTYTFSITANKTTVTIPAGKVLRQVIEGLNLETGTYCLSWQGTAQGKIGAGAYGASGITGAITGGTNTTIEFGPGTVSNVQLEIGSVATVFEQRPYSLELMLCQRYFYSSPGVEGLVGYGMVAASAYATVHVPVGQAMREAPTFVPPPSLSFRYGGADYPVSALGAGLAGSCVFINFTATGAVNGHAGVLRSSGGTWSLSAEL